MPINSKKKGNKFENQVANFFTDNGIKMSRDSASGAGTREKGDVSNSQNFHLECKAVKKINLLKVWNKAKVECKKTHNKPVLAIRFDNMPEGEFLITISNDHFLELLTGGQTMPEMDIKNKYKIQRLVDAAKELLKIYNLKE